MLTLPAFHCGLMAAVNKLLPLIACSAFIGTEDTVTSGPSAVCPFRHLQASQLQAAHPALHLHLQPTSGAAGSPYGSCSTACVLCNVPCCTSILGKDHNRCILFPIISSLLQYSAGKAVLKTLQLTLPPASFAPPSLFTPHLTVSTVPFPVLCILAVIPSRSKLILSV